MEEDMKINRSDVQTSIIEYVFSLSRLWEHFLKTRTKSDVTFHQFLLLASIERYFPDPPRIIDVAEKMIMTHQSVKKLAKQLEKKGFLELQQDRDDKRAFRLVLTAYHDRYWENRNQEDDEQIELLFESMSDHVLLEVKKGLRQLLGVASNLRRETC